MSEPVIGQADWLALAEAHGRATAELLVYKRALTEREAELQDARAQITMLSDQLYKPPDDEGGTP